MASQVRSKILTKFAYPAALMVVGVAAQKEMLSRDIMDVKQDLGKQIQNVKEELKEDIRGVKNELKHLGRRQTELEIRDMALAQQWLMDRVNANR